YSDLSALRSIAVGVLAVVVILGTSIVVTARVLAHETPRLDLGIDHLAPLQQASARTFSAPTTVVAADGQTLGQFQPERRFVPIEADQIPPLVASVVTASEDPDFYSHHGVTVPGVIRAALANARAGEAVEGGSTITQQVAKNLYTDGSRTLGRKIRELAIATELENHYSKQDLLAAYLNTTYFGEGAIGIRAAAAVYFGKPVEQVVGGGLRVETSLDPTTQRAALAAVAAQLPDPAGPTASVVVLDHRTGHVRALVGGRDWATSKVDLARGADGGGTGRQPGSS